MANYTEKGLVEVKAGRRTAKGQEEEGGATASF